MNDELVKLRTEVGSLRAERAALEDRLKVLEERVAHAENGRDNALAMRDEAQERARLSNQSAGRRIDKLKKLVAVLAEPLSEETKKQTAATVDEILRK